ncbi:DUF4362 domain-containing protein [Oceanobacillus picturae]|uniref:DUF4362 domain-containing protein n=1 Tax=Oceanobacillus picturae TaxID=171693 RepID=UPI000E68ED8D|nr:DUF4362 domain-containing protein [Oceanobacillus picturae]RIU92040.1 DUF4362 domain-containing protein [Oceanobacillus picturae]
MQKLLRFVSVLIITLVVVGCQNTEYSTKPNQEQNNIPDYTPSTEDVKDRNGDIENIKRFEEFRQNVENGRKDSVRVVRYTTEGDPMLHDLEYSGGIITSTRDTRRDTFGDGEINTTTCTSIKIIESTESTEYVLEGCENVEDDIILVNLNL